MVNNLATTKDVMSSIDQMPTQIWNWPLCTFYGVEQRDERKKRDKKKEIEETSGCLIGRRMEEDETALRDTPSNTLYFRTSSSRV